MKLKDVIQKIPKREFVQLCIGKELIDYCYLNETIKPYLNYEVVKLSTCANDYNDNSESLICVQLKGKIITDIKYFHWYNMNLDKIVTQVLKGQKQYINELIKSDRIKFVINKGYGIISNKSKLSKNELNRIKEKGKDCANQIKKERIKELEMELAQLGADNE